MQRAVGALFIAAFVACHANPDIDGSKVAKIDSPDCAQVCARLVDLCGYAPLGDDCTDDAGAGYCDVNFSDAINECIGQASSCEVAWDCQNTVASDDAAADADNSDGAGE